MKSESLEKSEELSAKGTIAPRVSLDSMKAKIASTSFLNLGEALECCCPDYNPHPDANASAPLSTQIMTLCVVVMKNGFVIIGKSAPASAENFDEEKGKVFAYEDAIRQLWPFEGYALREVLSK